MERDNEETLPVRMPASERTRHRILTPAEDALVGHVRGYCHDGAVCHLCTVERTLHEVHDGLREVKASVRQKDVETELLRQRYRAYVELPDAHRAVIDQCIAEAWRNKEQGDALLATDVAADVAQRLVTAYGVITYQD